MSGFFPDPSVGSFEDWAGAVVLLAPDSELGNYRDLPWQEWVRQMFERDAFSGILIPQPSDFDDWRDWAESFKINADGNF